MCRCVQFFGTRCKLSPRGQYVKRLNVFITANTIAKGYLALHCSQKLRLYLHLSTYITLTEERTGRKHNFNIYKYNV